MRPRLLAILLSVAVVMAVGVCPCGRTLLLDRAARSWGPVTAASVTTAGHCPACQGGGRRPPASGHGTPDARRCSSAVAGELPAGATHPPALYALPAVFQPSRPVDPLAPSVAGGDDHAVRSGLTPPPTLLSLFCCLTT